MEKVKEMPKEIGIQKIALKIKNMSEKLNIKLDRSDIEKICKSVTDGKINRD